MGSLEKVTTDEAVVKWADDVRKRLERGCGGRLRARAEDRRPRDQPHLRERRLHARRDARRRRGRGGRHRQLAHDQRDPVAHARRRRAAAPRGARRGLHAALRLSRAQRAARRRRQEADAEPAQCRRRLAAPEGLAHHCGAAVVLLGIRDRRARRRRPAEPLGNARVAQGARLSDQPVRRTARVDRRGRKGVPRVGAEAWRPRLRDRRDRDQGRRLRAAAATRRAPLSDRAGHARSSGRR